MKKIVILDGYLANPGDLSWAGLEKLGTLTNYDRTPATEVLERIKDATYVFTNKTPITRETIENAPNLKFIGVLATGYNIVDIDACREKGIVVSNVPGYSTDAVGQLVFAHILEICHNVGKHSEAVLAGDWTNAKDFAFWNFPLIELTGKTLGIVGFGGIGQKVAQIATAFGMNVLACANSDKSHLATENIKIVSMAEVLSQSDIISLHCPLTPATQNLINKDTIATMKDGVIIINTARGPVLNDQDVTDALNSGKIYACGVDVATIEPIPGDNPLLKAKNIYMTPHIAWAPKETRERLLAMTVENLEAFIKGTPIHVVS